ncbi:hypothetical protein NJ76_20925, partial [Rhodococcus sp. IITR03]
MAKKEGGTPPAVDPSALTEDALTAAEKSAIDAFAAAADLDELAQAKIDHLATRRPSPSPARPRLAARQRARRCRQAGQRPPHHRAGRLRRPQGGAAG